MGNEKSSPKVEQEGDHDLTIINTQEVHTDFHLSHELKLNLILGLLVLQLALTLYTTTQCYEVHCTRLKPVTPEINDTVVRPGHSATWCTGPGRNPRCRCVAGNVESNYMCNGTSSTGRAEQVVPKQSSGHHKNKVTRSDTKKTLIICKWI